MNCHNNLFLYFLLNFILLVFHEWRWIVFLYIEMTVAIFIIRFNKIDASTSCQLTCGRLTVEQQLFIYYNYNSLLLHFIFFVCLFVVDFIHNAPNLRCHSADSTSHSWKLQPTFEINEKFRAILLNFLNENYPPLTVEWSFLMSAENKNGERERSQHYCNDGKKAEKFLHNPNVERKNWMN